MFVFWLCIVIFLFVLLDVFCFNEIGICVVDEVIEICSKFVEYVELFRLRSYSGASSRGDVKVIGVEMVRFELEEVLIDEENCVIIVFMFVVEVVEV